MTRMALPAPHLDDRRFQDFVDDAKRLVQRRCPEWTDHNVGDPGVTLIEAFAMMADQLTYRLNRVPDRHYLRFLELIGVRLFPATAARVPVTFWLSAPQERVGFSTFDELAIVPVSLAELRSISAAGVVTDHAGGTPFPCFDPVQALED